MLAPLEVLGARERLRGDRHTGHARRPFERVHCSLTYDLEARSGDATPLECAQLIGQRFLL